MQDFGSGKLRHTSIIFSFIIIIVGYFNIPLYSQPAGISLNGDTLYWGDFVARKAAGAAPLEGPSALLGNSGLIASTTWGPEMRLTFLPESLEINGSPWGCANGDTLVVAFEVLDLNIGGVPYLMKSFDDGDTWSEPRCIVNPDTASVESNAFINLYQGRLLVAGHLFHNDRFFFHNLYSKASTDLGQSWEPYNYFFPQDQQYFGKIGGGSSFDTLLFAFYHGEGHNSEPIDSVRSVVSMNNGLSWSPPKSVVYANPDAYPFSVRYSEGRVHLLYPEISPNTGLAEVYYVRSDDWGTSWTEPVVVSDDSCEHSQWPYLSASEDGHLIASWFDYKYGWGPSLLTGGILYRISSDNGVSWGPEGRLTYNHYATGSFTYIKGNQIGLIWQDSRDGSFQSNLFYAESSDLGATWSDEFLLTDAPGMCLYINLVLSGDNLYMFWADARDGPNFNYQIYFRRAEVLVGIDDEGDNTPVEIGIRAYPNPFNPTTTLSFNLSTPQDVSIKIYNIMGQEIRELCNGTKPSGINTLIWDGTDSKGKPVSTGMYFCKISTEEHQQTVKMTVLR